MISLFLKDIWLVQQIMVCLNDYSKSIVIGIHLGYDGYAQRQRKEHIISMNMDWNLQYIVNIQKIMNRLWRWGYKSVKIVNMVLIMNDVLRRCGWMVKIGGKCEQIVKN